MRRNSIAWRKTRRYLNVAPGSVTPPFVPTDIAGCVWWLRADLGVTESSGVSLWADQSGVGDSARNATDDSGAWTRPGRMAANPLYNNKPTIGPFTATASPRLRTASSWGAPYSNFTLIVVGLVLATSNGRYFLAPSATVYAGVVSKLGLAFGFVGSTPKEISSGRKSLTSPTYAILECNFAAGANGKIYVGQTAAPNGTLDISGEPVLLGANGMYIGGYPSANSAFAVEDLAEVMAFNKGFTDDFTPQEKSKVSTYMTRYGFAAA